MQNILKIVFVIIGTMIGAGFASGQEMYLFFFSYGVKGLIGIFISSFILGLAIYKTFQIVNKYGGNNYKDFLTILKIKNTRLKEIINIVINIFILITFFIMIAGFGAYFEQELGWNSLLGSSLLAITTFLVFMTSIKGVVKANEILVPLLIGILVIIGSINLKEIPISSLENYLLKNDSFHFILSAILYGSYNSILLVPVLLTLKNYLKDTKQILSITILSSLIILFLSILVFLLLVRVEVDITKLEMPAVYVVSHMSRLFQYGYGFIILGSIFTTAISLGNSFLQNVAKTHRSYTQIAAIMCITSVLISQFGFSNLVSLLYPIFGYLGLVQIIQLIKTKPYKNQ